MKIKLNSAHIICLKMSHRIPVLNFLFSVYQPFIVFSLRYCFNLNVEKKTKSHHIILCRFNANLSDPLHERARLRCHD